MRKNYWRYATLVIPAHTPLATAANHEPRSFAWPLTVRGRLLVTRENEPRDGSAWFFIHGAYSYYVSRTAPLTASDERFVPGGKS